MNRCLSKRKTYFLTIILVLISVPSFSAINANTLYTLIKNNESNVSRLNMKINSMQDENSRLYGQISTLRRDLESQKAKNRQLESSVSNLKKQLLSDRKQIKNNMDNLISQVSKETSRALAQKRYSQPKQSSSPTKYAVYKVQPGATLNAISKAYGVSVNDIKKANNLSGYIIRVGQELKIPQ